MNVVLLRHTEDPDQVCAAAAASCYSASPASDLQGTMSPKRRAKLLRAVVSRGHHSVVEHAVFTFSLEGVSRAMTHQLVRHRIASYSQQSQRYVRFDSPTYVTPPEVEGRPDALPTFDAAVEGAWGAYREMVEAGVPEEDARYVLPNAATTNITVTMNARELLHFFRLRCCLRAQWEIRRAALKMLDECKRVAPVIFQDAGRACLSGPCPDDAEDCPLYPGRPGPPEEGTDTARAPDPAGEGGGR
jgi:thymidylate synthase (FAD)